MNKNYRVIWNDVRNCFVVVGENAKTRGKPRSTRKVIAIAVGALFLAPGAALAICPGTTPVSAALTTPQCYGDQNVTVDSNGSIKVTNNGSTTAVRVANPYTSTFTNNGTISATIPAASSSRARGIYFNGALSGTLANSGTISALVTDRYGSAAGVYVSGSLSGALTNSGTISGKLTATGNSSAYAYGIRVTGALSGTLTNSGTISASASNLSNSRAFAYGVYVNGAASNSLTNSGTISATASANNNPANAYGVYVNGIISGTLTNSGNISAVGVNGGSGYAVANGIYSTGNLSGTLTNSGQISATATSRNGFASAYGLQLTWCCNQITGTLTNSGTISAIASGRTALAAGIKYYDLAAAGTVTNSGTISARATANGGGSGAQAYGIQSWLQEGTLTNTGSISAVANNAGGNASARGVNVYSTLSGVLTNSGTISAVANGGTNGSARGIYIGSLTGVVNNSGTISATGLGATPASQVYSIYVSGGTGTINNMSAGLLDGKVFAGGSVNLNNAGTIDTRMQASSVGGNYTQAPTGVLKFGATSNAAHGSMNVTGMANLAAGTGIAVNAAAGNTLAAGTMSSVLTSGGLTMSGVTVVKNILALNYTAVANGNNVDLMATSTGLTTVTAALAGGANAGVGGVLDSLLANIFNQPQPLQNYLYSLTSQTTAQGVADSVSKIVPLISTGVTQVGLGASQGINNVVLARLEGAQGRSAGDKFYGDKKFWLKPFGSWANQDDRNGVSGYAARTAGMVGGADADVGDANRLGLAFGYARSNVDSNSTVAPQNAKVDSYQLMAYGSHKLDPATDANFQAGVGLHNNDGRRSINFPGASLVASSSYSSWSASLGGGVAHTMKWNESTSFTPSLRADYTLIRNKSYMENGAGALNLNVNSNDASKFIIAADGKFSHELSGETKLVGNVGVGYDLIHKASSVTSELAGAPGAAFSTQGITPSALLLRGGAGMVFRAREGVDVTARYDLEARTGFTNQTASVNVRWAF